MASGWSIERQTSSTSTDDATSQMMPKMAVYCRTVFSSSRAQVWSYSTQA